MKFTKKIFFFIIISIIIYASFLILSDFQKLFDKINDFKIEYLPLILLLVPLGWLALYTRWVLFITKFELFTASQTKF